MSVQPINRVDDPLEASPVVADVEQPAEEDGRVEITNAKTKH